MQLNDFWNIGHQKSSIQREWWRVCRLPHISVHLRKSESGNNTRPALVLDTILIREKQTRSHKTTRSSTKWSLIRVISCEFVWIALLGTGPLCHDGSGVNSTYRTEERVAT